jgi:adenine-specific DNA-methyltransferase
MRGFIPMRTSDQVSADKLRGGFYSPPALVSVCLDRALELLGGRENLTVLEPSAGDGGFICGLAQHALGERVAEVTAVEIIATEAHKAAAALAIAVVTGRVVTGSVLDPQVLATPHDVAVGNPPFVRFQFLSETDRAHIDQLGGRIGVAFKGVSNLWIPVFLAALNNLRDGGVFSFIVPAECFTGLSGRAVRTWLSQHATKLRFDLFPPNSFPAVLQEVVILSGQVTRGSAHGAKVLVHDHALGDSWRHVLDEDASTWTGLLLRPDHLTALADVRTAVGVHRFGDIAKLSVATVTGANDFFCSTDETRTTYDLTKWTRPLLARVRHAAGLDFTDQDHSANLAAGHPVWLIDTSIGISDIAASDLARFYLSLGEAERLHTRYKCRIRDPWWQVPVVRPGTLMLSKRSNHYPRLIRNSACVVTTDTIYQGGPLPAFTGRERDIVGSFHNSLTLLTAEMYGRSFGGGVLELVPSEVASLLLPLAEIADEDFQSLDDLVRAEGADSEQLVQATDALITDQLGLDCDTWRVVAEARHILRDRRLART